MGYYFTVSGFVPMSEENFHQLEEDLSDSFEDFSFDQGLHICSYGKHHDLDETIKKISVLMPINSYANISICDDNDRSESIIFLRGPKEDGAEGEIRENYVRTIYPINPFSDQAKELSEFKKALKDNVLASLETSGLKITWEELFNE